MGEFFSVLFRASRSVSRPAALVVKFVSSFTCSSRSAMRDPSTSTRAGGGWCTMLCRCRVRARISLTTWAMGRSSAARTKMVRLKFEMRPSLGRDSCDRIACRSQPPTRGPPKHARSATRSLKRSSAAAAARAADSDSDSEIVGEGGSAKASEASSAAEMTCEEWYHSLSGLASVRGEEGRENPTRET